MARIIISLSLCDIGNMLLGGEIDITPNISKFDNLSEIVLKANTYGCTDNEVNEDHD